MLPPLDFLLDPHVHEPAIQRMTEYLERQSYFGVFFLLFLGAFGPSPPEEVVLLIAGFLVFKKVARFPLMVGAELLGIVISDSILYGFGRLFGQSLDRHRFMKKIFPPAKVRKIQASFHRHRYRFLFLARYLYGLRPVVFFTAGASRMRIGPFVLTDLAAALVLYFLAERFLVKRHIVSEDSFWIRQATGTKIAAVVGTVVLTVLVGRFLFPHGVREGLHLRR